MAKVPTLPLVVMIWMSLSCTIEVVLASRVAVIVLEQSLACCTTYITEGGNATACASLVYTYGDLPLATNISVRFTTTNGSALSPKDYKAIISEERVFTVGSVEGQSVCVTVTTIDDTVVEDTETFQITLTTNSPNVTIGDRAGGVTFTVYMNDNDVATVALVSNFTFLHQWENNTSIQICAQLVKNELETSVSASLRLYSGTANVGTDTWNNWVWIGFSSGSPIGSISCGYGYIYDDNHVENDEDFTITLEGYYRTVATPYNNTVHVTIIDNDVALIGLASGNPTSTPETVTTLSVCIALKNWVVLDIPISVYFEAISGTATKGKDFIQAESGNFVFYPGSSYSCIHVDILQDTILEYNEYIYFSTYCNSSHAVCTAGNGSIQIIEDGDSITVGFDVESFNGTEGNNSDPVEICAVMLQGSLERLIPVYVTTHVPGATATVGKDYIPLVAAEIVFSYGASADNETASCIYLTVINDSILENAEFLSVSISSLLQYVFTSPTMKFAYINIFEDPNDYITVGFASGTPSVVTEGVNLTLKVCPTILNGSLEKDIFVFITTMDITAKSPSDYGSESAELKFAYGQKVGDAVCFTIVINNDANVLEYTEQFKVSLMQHYTAIHFPLQQGSILVTILEDPNDGITVGFWSSTYQRDEAGGPISVCIQMYNGNIERNVSMEIISIDGTAEAYSDYTMMNSTITFTSGMFSGNSICTYSIIIDDDVVEEDVETFNLSLIATEPLVTTISLSLSIISIQERNNDVVDIGLTNKRYIGTEGCNVTVCAKILKGSIERTVSVHVFTFSGTAIEGMDFTGVSRVELKMPMYSGVNDTICTDLMITNDTDIEPEEQFTVALETVDPAVNITIKTGIVIILIDSHDVAVFEMKVNAVTVTEGRNNTFLICTLLKSLSGILTTSLLVGVVTKDVSSSVHVGQDYNMDTRFLLFPASSIPGETFMCSTVFIIDDYVLENMEEFIVSLVSNETSIAIDASLSQTIVWILEDNLDSITFGFSAAHSVVNETEGDVEICIDIIHGALERDVSVYLQTMPITASSNIDYIDGERNITFTSGLSAFRKDKMCTNITIINDNVLEHDEDFQELLLPTPEDHNIVLIPAILSVDVVTIIEDPNDRIEVGFDPNIYNVSVSDDMVLVCAAIFEGTLERDVTLLMLILSNEKSTDAVIVGPDVTSVHVAVQFIAGQSEFANRTQCIRIRIFNDGFSKPVEEIVVVLDKDAADSNVVEFSEGLDNASVFIYNKVLIPDYVFQFTNTSNEQLEGSPVVVCLQLIKYPQNGQVQTIPVILSTRGVTATGGQDYDDSKHVLLFHPELLNGTVVTMTECTKIQTIDDHAIEGDETFEVHLEFLYPSSTSVINRGSALVTIRQNNNSFAIGMFLDKTLTGVAGEDIDVCVRLEDATGEIERALNVSIRSINETAFRGVDFELLGPETISFSPGSTIGSTKCLTVQLFNKTAANVNSFTLQLTSDDPAFKILMGFGALSIRILSTSLQVPRVTMTAELVVTKEELRVAQLCAIIKRGTLAHDTAFHVLILGTTATEFQDYTYDNFTINFESGDAINATHCISVIIIDDDLLETNETFFAVLLPPDDYAIAASPTVTRVVIQDDRGKVIVIGFETTYYTVWEANTTISICCEILHTNLTLGRPLEIGVVVLSNLTTATGYSNPGSFEFSVGLAENSSQCFKVTILDNDFVEDDEELVLTIVSLDPNAFVVIAQGYDITTLHIKEDPKDYIEIHWIKANYSAKESEDVEICAEIVRGALRKEVVVMVNISLNTATFEDLIIPTTTVVFKSGQSAVSTNSKSCILVHIIDDMIVETIESFFLEILSSDIVHVSPSSTIATVTILDDFSDVITIDWSERAYSTAEEETKVIICADILNGSLETNVSVPFMYSQGTASKDKDFTISLWFLTFSSGQSHYNHSTSCVSVLMINDSILEDTESFTLEFTLTNRTRFLSFKTSVNITIYEDPSDVVEFGMIQNKYAAIEGLNNTLTLCAVLKVGNLGKKVMLNLENEAGSMMANYNVKGPIQFEPGSSAIDNSTQCFIVDIINDDIVEDTEVFILKLSVNSSGCSIFGHPPSNAEAEITIFDDLTDEMRIGWSRSSYAVTEGDNSQILICAYIANGTLQTSVIVPFINLTGSAIFGSDFTLSSWFLKFTSGQSQYNQSTSCVSMFILNDTILEDTEFLILELTPANRTSYLQLRNDANITVYEDQNDRVEFSLTKNAFVVTEGSENEISVCVLLTAGNLAKPVKLVLQSQSQFLTDYSVEESVTFQPGSSSSLNATQCFVVHIINDEIVENTEQFLLRLNLESRYCTVSGESEMNLTIIEDPADVVILSLQSSSYFIREASGTLSLEMCIVIQKGSLERDVSITMVVTNGTATYGADYTLKLTDVTLTSGQNQSYNNEQCTSVTIYLLNDRILEYNESFSLSLVSAHPAIAGAINKTTVVIMEDPSDYVEMGFVQLLYEVNQDQLSVPLLIDIKMVSGNLQRNVSLTISLVSNVTTSIAFGTSILLLTNTTFTYGETSGAVHHEILNISSISGAEFASLVLQPIPKDRDVIRIANTQAIIKITVHSAFGTSLPGIIGGTSLLFILICAVLLMLATLTIFYKNKKANKPMPISEASPVQKSPSQQSRVITMDGIVVEKLI